MIGKFVAHDDSRLRFGSLNQVPGDAINPERPIKPDANPLIHFRFWGHSGHGGPGYGPCPGRDRRSQFTAINITETENLNGPLNLAGLDALSRQQTDVTRFAFFGCEAGGEKTCRFWRFIV